MRLTSSSDDTLENAPGGRNTSTGELTSGATGLAGGGPETATSGTPDYIPKGFSKDDIKNMGGSLKVHVRLALEVDIRVVAKVKGDICIGIL